MHVLPQEPDALAAAGAGHLRLRFQQALALGQLPAAWAAAALLVDRDVWRALGDAAVHALDVDLAMRCWPVFPSLLRWRTARLPKQIWPMQIARLQNEDKPPCKTYKLTFVLMPRGAVVRRVSNGGFAVNKSTVRRCDRCTLAL